MSTVDPRDLPVVTAYERARAAVLRMKEAEAGDTARPSDYWAEELENIDYLAEATPLILRKLRHHAFHITGIRPYDYRTKDDRRRESFEARYRALLEMGGGDLFVPESPALGGFGYDLDGGLANVDTLKFLEVLVGMRKAGVLQHLRELGRRAMICEIGAGWGGFAYQLKTLVPGTTYVIVDFAELFLFSATYLATVFPDARVHFCSPGESFGEAWRAADFVFVPHTQTAAVAAAPLDLTINMVSFQEMTDAQVRAYADMAAAAQCPLLYSLNRERSPYNTQLASVSQALSSRYRLSEVAVLDSDYTSAMKKPPKPGRSVERSELGYRHLVGRLQASGAPRVALGMTLYNRSTHLREAMDSLLAQQYGNFRLLLLDDASTDGTEAIAREYEARDARVRYVRHASRQAMIATWREVAELAARECPSPEYFAWVSDHDRWHPRWLDTLVRELDAHPEAVLAYPITQRITPDGEAIEKGARHFDATGLADPRGRWTRFCRDGVGSGDMVYGLMRLDAMRRAGIFRTVLRPDRLLVAEMALHGEIRQVRDVLWFRRQFAEASISRQRQTLMLAGSEPRWFAWPPWVQHSVVLYREYVRADPPALAIARGEWLRMLALYQWTYAWRHFRKSETSHGIGRVVKQGVWGWKMTKHYYRHALFNTLVGARAFRARARRAGRRTVYEVLMFTHRIGLRGRGQTPSR